MIGGWRHVRHFLTHGERICNIGHGDDPTLEKEPETIRWNQRNSGDEFAYGTELNSFLAENANLLTGPVLSLAEGEGRNAVFPAAD